MLPLTMYSSETCEDTALVRDRLRALGISFDEHTRQNDARVDEILAKWNHNQLVTPTLVFGDDQMAIAEPTLKELEETLREAGYEFQAPRALEIRDERKNQRLPNFTLPATNGADVTLYQLRGKRAVLFFAHTASERICQGYARQLTMSNHRALFEEYNALPLLILPTELETARSWAHAFAHEYPALADVDGRAKQRISKVLGVDASNVLLVILDAYCAPRAYSSATDAGGLIAPSEIMEWLRLIDCECDE
ncbi:MAG TPA: redoxin domain-containing protein [Anaerolineae bacterium]|nr:redoxin domain-containing protein [Anaerolineae bacterium]